MDIDKIKDEDLINLYSEINKFILELEKEKIEQKEV